MNRSIKIFGAFIVTFCFCALILSCSNKAMFADQAKAAVAAFNENGIHFPDLNESVLADIIQTAYVTEYNKKHDSYDYTLSFDAADIFKIDYIKFTSRTDIGAKEYAEELKKFIADSLRKAENAETKKNYSVKCKFEKNDGGWICKINPEDINEIKSERDLYAENLFIEKINNSEEYRIIVEREIEPYIIENIISKLSYPSQYFVNSIENFSIESVGIELEIEAADFTNYHIENPDALLSGFDFKALTSNPLEDYRKILREYLKKTAEKKEAGVKHSKISLLFSRGKDGILECESDIPLRFVEEINDITNSQVEEVIIKAEEESDIFYILSRYYGGRLFQNYPEYLNCSELAEFVKVEDIKLSGTGKYDVTLECPAFNELTKVAETNFLNSITKKYYDTNEISFNKENIADFYNKDDITQIKNKDTVTFTYDRHSSAAVSDGTVNAKFETMLAHAIEESNAKWLVKEQSYPSSGVLYNNSGGGNSFINFGKFPGADVCYYKLYNSSDKLVVTIFLNTESDSVGLYLPSGSYYIKYSYGTKWYGTNDAFGSSGYYGKSESFVVLYGYMYDYTFVYSGGNTDLEAIDRSDF